MLGANNVRDSYCGWDRNKKKISFLLVHGRYKYTGTLRVFKDEKSEWK